MGEGHLHVSVGNLNVDIAMQVPSLPILDSSVVASDATISPGGSAANYAVAVAFYGHRASLIASTSNHPIVDDLLKSLQSRGVDVKYVKRVDGSPGIVVSVILESGEKAMFKYRGVNELLSPNDVPLEALREASIVHVASVNPNIASEISSRASRLGVLVSYDPGVYASTSKSRVLEVLSKVNVLFLNRVEAKELAGSSIDSLLKHGVDVVVVKKGAGGAFAIQHGQKCYYGVSKPIVRPVNTTGAGDAFDAFFNSSYLDYKDVGRALSYALAAATLKTGCKSSTICYDRGLFKKQLSRTVVEVSKSPEDWVIED